MKHNPFLGEILPPEIALLHYPYMNKATIPPDRKCGGMKG